MNKKVKKNWDVLVKRWNTSMPVFFKRLSYTAGAIGAGILAFHLSVQEMGGVEPEWFSKYFSTIAGICGGIVATSKFTRTYKDNE